MSNKVFNVRIVSEAGYNGLSGVELGFVVPAIRHHFCDKFAMVLGADLNEKGAHFVDPCYSYSFEIGRDAVIVE